MNVTDQQLAALLKRHERFACMIAVKIAASRAITRTADLEDLKQAARLGLAAAIQRYDPQHASGAGLITWAFFLIRSAVQDECRRLRWKGWPCNPVLLTLDEARMEGDSADDGITAVEDAEEREVLMQRVDAAIDTLEPRDRDDFIRRWKLEEPTTVLAERHKITHQRVSQRLAASMVIVRRAVQL